MIARRLRLRPPPSSPFSCSGNLVQPCLPSPSLSLFVKRASSSTSTSPSGPSVIRPERGTKLRTFTAAVDPIPFPIPPLQSPTCYEQSAQRAMRCCGCGPERARQGGERSFGGVPLSDAVGFVGGMRPTFARSFRESQSAIRSDGREAHSQFLILLHERSHEGEGFVLHAAQEFEVVITCSIAAAAVDCQCSAGQLNGGRSLERAPRAE